MPKKRRYVLSIDWDFFTGDCQAKSSCCGCLWKGCYGDPTDKVLRRFNDQAYAYSMLDPAKIELQLRSILSWSVWKDVPRTAFDGTPVVIAECHGSIRSWIERGDFIVNLDAHSDDDRCEDYYEPPACYNWAGWAKRKMNCEVEWIADWRDHVPRTKKFDLVFFCFSRPYTPPMWDRWFYRAVSDLARATGTEPRFFGLGARELKRAWRRQGG